MALVIFISLSSLRFLAGLYITSAHLSTQQQEDIDTRFMDGRKIEGRKANSQSRLDLLEL